MNWADFLDRRILPYLIAIFALFSAIPLVWVRLFGTSIAPYHIVSLFLIAAIAMAPKASEAFFKIAKAGKLIWMSCLFLGLAMLISFTRSTVLFEPFFFAKYIAFVLTALVTATLLYMIIRRGGFPAVAFVPFVAGSVFLAFISIQFTVAEIDPFTLVSLAIAQADPNIIINQLFRATFASSNEDGLVKSNLKQSLSFAFLATIPLGLLALSYVKFASKPLKWIAFAGIAFALIMTIAPFSRAAWLSLALTVVCFSVAYLRTAVGLSIFAGILGLGLPAVFILGRGTNLFLLLEARLTASDSLDARLFNAEEHWQAIGRSPVFGRTEIVDGWAHNVIIDAWSAFGILGMVAALMLFVSILFMLIKALILTLSAPLKQRRVHATIAALLCPALVRLVTAPNVTIDFSIWVGLGIAVALAADAWGETDAADVRPKAGSPIGKPAFEG